jgi:tellurite methyltransferase
VRIFVEFFKEKPESIQEKENEIYEKYEKSPHMEVSRVVEYMNKETSKTALDVGCGGGRNSILLAENGFTVDAVDRNKIAL